MPPGAQRVVDELTLDALTFHTTESEGKREGEGERSRAHHAQHARERMLVGDASGAPVAAGGRDATMQQQLGVQSLASAFASFAVASGNEAAGVPNALGAATIVAPRRTSDSGAATLL
jgi:hypothetical protein